MSGRTHPTPISIAPVTLLLVLGLWALDAWVGDARAVKLSAPPQLTSRPLSTKQGETSAPLRAPAASASREKPSPSQVAPEPPRGGSVPTEMASAAPRPRERDPALHAPHLRTLPGYSAELDDVDVGGSLDAEPEPVGHEPYISQVEQVAPEEHRLTGFEPHSMDRHGVTKDEYDARVRDQASHPLSTNPEDFGESTLDLEHRPEPPFPVKDYPQVVADLQSWWEVDRVVHPHRYPAHAPRLRDCLQNISFPSSIVLFGFDSTQCDGCTPEAHQAVRRPDDGTVPPLPSFLEQFNAAAATIAQEEAHVKITHRDYHYWRLDVARARRAYHDLQQLHPHHAWTVPFVAVVNPHDVLSLGYYPVLMPRMHQKTFEADTLHFLRRLQHHKHAAPLHGEADLMRAIYESSNDGVCVVLFHDPLTMRRLGRAVDAVERIMREEHVHLHFSTVWHDENTWRHVGAGDDRPGSSSFTPQLKPRRADWMRKYNPDDFDAVAFVVVESAPDDFFSVGFNFPEAYEDEVANLKHFYAYAPFREFVDLAKGHRHHGSGRRWHGVRHVRHFGASLHDSTLRVHHPTANPTLDCRRVREGDVLSMTVVGECAGHGTVFLNFSSPTLVAIAVEYPGALTVTPQLVPYLLGLCAGRRHEIYLPPSASKSSNGEVYHVDILSVVHSTSAATVPPPDESSGDAAVASNESASSSLPDSAVSVPTASATVHAELEVDDIRESEVLRRSSGEAEL